MLSTMPSPETISDGSQTALLDDAPATRAAKSANRFLRVLIAEDNPTNRHVARLLLQKRGHNTVIANNGCEAIVQWRNGHFDIILMDVSMPVMDGMTAASRIRAEEAVTGHHIPIIAMTAHALDRARQECFSHGMDGYLCKPLNPRAFLDTVEHAASHHFDLYPQTVKSKNPISVKTNGHSPSGAATKHRMPAGHTLVNLDKYVGDDRDLQRQAMVMGKDTIIHKLPELRVAVIKGDRKDVRDIAHYLRGSLGMLGLQELIDLTEELEYRDTALTDAQWRARAGILCSLVERIQREIAIELAV